MELSFILNGRRVVCDVSDNQTLLDLLRNSLGVTSVKKGCEQGECGVCTVLLEGEPVTSCLVLAGKIDGREITTIEGLADDPKMKVLREAFLEEGAVQCGFCTPGMLLSAYALIRSNPNPTADQVKEAIEGNLCRCTGYVKII
ncbi:MAG: (2Fe-2S)-binding protein, partial [Candidatus Bathyarchaeia archaeon]